MLEDDSARDAALHDELAAVARAMVSATQRDEIIGVVPTAFFACSNVMNVYKICVRAAWHLTPMPVAS